MTEYKIVFTGSMGAGKTTAIGAVSETPPIVTDVTNTDASHPDVYAAGDVANWAHPRLRRRVRVEHWDNARKGGAAAARSMLGETVSYDHVPFFFTDQYDLGMEYSGSVGPDGFDGVAVRGDLESREFVAFWLKDQAVIAGMNVNVWDVSGPIQQLIQSQQPVDVTKLTDTSVPISELAR